MISNFRAIIFEFHQFLFQFRKGICLSSKNISDNLVRQVRDGFPPQFYYHYRRNISFHQEGFCRIYPFQDVGSVVATYSEFYERSSLGFFLVESRYEEGL